MPNYEEIIQQSQENVKALSEKLKELDKLHEDIKKLIVLPGTFDGKFQEIVKLTEDYTNTLGASTKKYLDGNNTLFTSNLSELSEKIKDLQKEITRLLNTDFKKLFNELQEEFIVKTRNDLAVELEKFDKKSKDLQLKIDALKKQVDRLQNIDLEKHFDKLQKTLSEIFGAINSINLTLTAITQTINDIVQSLGIIQTRIQTGFEETNSNINHGFRKIIEIISDTENKIISELSSHISFKSKELEQQLENHNNVLRKEVKINRIIQLIGIVVIITILIYIVVK